MAKRPRGATSDGTQEGYRSIPSASGTLVQVNDFDIGIAISNLPDEAKAPSIQRLMEKLGTAELNHMYALMGKRFVGTGEKSLGYDPVKQGVTASNVFKEKAASQVSNAPHVGNVFPPTSGKRSSSTSPDPSMVAEGKKSFIDGAVRVSKGKAIFGSQYDEKGNFLGPTPSDTRTSLQKMFPATAPKKGTTQSIVGTRDRAQDIIYGSVGHERGVPGEPLVSIHRDLRGDREAYPGRRSYETAIRRQVRGLSDTRSQGIVEDLAPRKYSDSVVTSSVDVTQRALSQNQARLDRQSFSQGVDNLTKGPLSYALKDIEKTFTNISKVAAQTLGPVIKAAAPWTNFHYTGPGGVASTGSGGGWGYNDYGAYTPLPSGHSVGGPSGGAAPPPGGGSRGSGGVPPPSGTPPSGSRGTSPSPPSGSTQRGWASQKLHDAGSQVKQQFWHATTWGAVAPVAGGIAYTAAKVIGGDPYTGRAVHNLIGASVNAPGRQDSRTWAYQAAGSQPFLHTQELLGIQKEAISAFETPYSSSTAHRFQQLSEELQAYKGITLESPEHAVRGVARTSNMAIEAYQPWAGRNILDVAPSIMAGRAMVTQTSSVVGSEIETAFRYAGPTLMREFGWSPGEASMFIAKYVKEGASPTQTGAYVKGYVAGEDPNKMAKVSLIRAKYLENAKTMGFKGKAIPWEMLQSGFFTSKKNLANRKALAKEQRRLRRRVSGVEGRKVQLETISEMEKSRQWAFRAGIGGRLLGKESNTLMSQMIAAEPTEQFVQRHQNNFSAVRAEEDNPTIVPTALEEQKKGTGSPEEVISKSSEAIGGYLNDIAKWLRIDRVIKGMGDSSRTTSVAWALGDVVKGGNADYIKKQFAKIEDLAKVGDIDVNTMSVFGRFSHKHNMFKAALIGGMLDRYPRLPSEAGLTDLNRFEKYYPELGKRYYDSPDIYTDIPNKYGIPTRKEVAQLRRGQPSYITVTPVDESKSGNKSLDTTDGISKREWNSMVPNSSPSVPQQGLMTFRDSGSSILNTDTMSSGFVGNNAGFLPGFMEKLPEAIASGFLNALERMGNTSLNQQAPSITIQMNMPDGTVKKDTVEPSGQSDTNKGVSSHAWF